MMPARGTCLSASLGRMLFTSSSSVCTLFRGGLVFKAHRLLYHSTLGLRVIKKKKKKYPADARRRQYPRPHK